MYESEIAGHPFHWWTEKSSMRVELAPGRLDWALRYATPRKERLDCVPIEGLKEQLACFVGRSLFVEALIACKRRISRGIYQRDSTSFARASMPESDGETRQVRNRSHGEADCSRLEMLLSSALGQASYNIRGELGGP
jgi:hypothetical protein